MKILYTLISGLILFFHANAQSPKLEWAKSIGGDSSSIYVRSMEIDASGNIYATGTFRGTIDFDPNISKQYLISAVNGVYETFIMKLDASGNFIWAKNIGVNSKTILVDGFSLSVDNFGNVYSTGWFRGTVDFDPGAGIYNLKSNDTIYCDLFITKLDSSGNFVWAKIISGALNERGNSVALDGNGDIYITGFFQKTTDFDPGSGIFNLTNYGNPTIFILKLNRSGNFVWAKEMGGKWQSEASLIKIDKFKNAYTTGFFYDTVDFNPNASVKYNLIAGKKFPSAFISKLDSLGNFVWAKKISGNSMGGSIAFDDLNNVYISGTFKDTADFDPGTGIYKLTSKNTSHFILKLKPTGEYIWAKNIGGYNIGSSSFSMDGSGNIYSTGAFTGIIDFDPGLGTFNLKADSLSDIFISRLDIDGNLVWAKKIDGIGYNYGVSIRTDTKGNIYTLGAFEKTVDFEVQEGVPNLISKGNGGMYIFKLRQDSCQEITLMIDSLENILCGDTLGYASAHTVRGKTPYKYEWDTKPAIKVNNANFNKRGIYSLSVTDANSCKRQVSVLINSSPIKLGVKLSTDLIGGVFRSGSGRSIKAIGYNEGCISVKGRLVIVLDSNVKYKKAFPIPDLIIGDTLFWNFKDLNYDSEPLKPIIDVVASTKLTFKDSVHFTLFIKPTDEGTLLNLKRYSYAVRNSYDPNIISVYPQGECEQNFVLKNKPLIYTVQFQNTGNAKAINIYILDTLNSNLDINSLRILGQSHKPPITEILKGGVIKFRFDNIYLPDSFSNEKESHGYIIFEVMPLSNVLNGTVVKGKAGIYFDFNKPILTNEIMNTLIETIPSCKVYVNPLAYKSKLNIYPNPSDGNLTISIQNNGKGMDIEIYDLAGKRLKSVHSKDSFYNTNFDLLKGIYFIKIFSGEEQFVQRIMIK